MIQYLPTNRPTAGSIVPALTSQYHAEVVVVVSEAARTERDRRREGGTEGKYGAIDITASAWNDALSMWRSILN